MVGYRVSKLQDSLCLYPTSPTLKTMDTELCILRQLTKATMWFISLYSSNVQRGFVAFQCFQNTDNQHSKPTEQNSVCGQSRPEISYHD
jgi:hypothetical protein